MALGPLTPTTVITGPSRRRVGCRPVRARSSASRMPLLLTCAWCLIAAALFGCLDSDPQQPTQRVYIGDKPFELELALDHESRYQGLSDRQSIDAGGGMLFVFPQPAPLEFVMRRCLVPIDLIYLGPGGRVVAMHRMATEPYETPDNALRRYPSRWPAQFAIELPQGTIQSSGLKPGMKVILPIETLKTMAR